MIFFSSREETSKAKRDDHYSGPTRLQRFVENTSGATAVEYGLLAGLVAVGLAGGLGALADLVNLLFDTISGEAEQVSNTMNGGG